MSYNGIFFELIILKLRTRACRKHYLIVLHRELYLSIDKNSDKLQNQCNIFRHYSDDNYVICLLFRLTSIH